MKKNLLLIFCSAIVITGCSNNLKQQVPVKDVVNQHFEALNKHDIDGLVSEYSADAKLNSSGWEAPRTGPEAIRGAYSRYFQSSSELKYRITHTIYGDTTAVVEYESTGSIPTNDATIQPYMAGKKFTIQNCAVMRIENGKITAETTYFDQVSFLRQIGYFDQPGMPK